MYIGDGGHNRVVRFSASGNGPGLGLANQFTYSHLCRTCSSLLSPPMDPFSMSMDGMDHSLLVSRSMSRMGES